MANYETEEDWQAGRDRLSELLTRLHGAIVGTFIIRHVAENGPHPYEIRAGWQSVPLPVRERYAPQVNEVVKVFASDGFNALVELNTEEAILQYWIDLLDGKADDWTTFDFLPSDGEYIELPVA